MTASLSDADILDRAADRLEKPGAWTREANARNEHGGWEAAASDTACSWCMYGAIWAELAAAGRPYGVADLARCVERPLGMSMEQWNDAPGRTQAEVVAALRETAKRLRGEGS